MSDREKHFDNCVDCHNSLRYINEVLVPEKHKIRSLQFEMNIPDNEVVFRVLREINKYEEQIELCITKEVDESE